MFLIYIHDNQFVIFYIYTELFLQLLELYASGKLKPGLNIPVENDKVFINNVVSSIILFFWYVKLLNYVPV